MFQFDSFRELKPEVERIAFELDTLEHLLLKGIAGHRVLTGFREAVNRVRQRSESGVEPSLPALLTQRIRVAEQLAAQLSSDQGS